jgi:hypothetical protein
VATATRVRLLGTFPDPVHVWFGEQPGVVEQQSPTSIDVLTPMRALPGLVDITLQRTGQGVVLTQPGGFLFEESVPGDPGSPPPPTSPTPEPGDGGGPSTSPPSSPTTTTAPTAGGPAPPSDTPAPPADTVPSQPTPTTAPPADGGGAADTGGTSTRSARASVSIELSDLGGGLRGSRVTGLDPSVGAPRCTSGTCTMA